MRALASLICGFVFGWGLFISGMMLPTKVLGFLDIFAIPSGNWDPSLAVVMAAGLLVTGIGYAVLRPRTPLFEAKSQWPTQTAIDGPLVAGSIRSGSAGVWSVFARDRPSPTSQRCPRASSSLL